MKRGWKDFLAEGFGELFIIFGAVFVGANVSIPKVNTISDFFIIAGIFILLGIILKRIPEL